MPPYDATKFIYNQSITPVPLGRGILHRGLGPGGTRNEVSEMIQTLRCKHCGADYMGGRCQECGSDEFVDVSAYYHPENVVCYAGTTVPAK